MNVTDATAVVRELVSLADGDSVSELANHINALSPAQRATLVLVALGIPRMVGLQYGGHHYSQQCTVALADCLEQCAGFPPLEELRRLLSELTDRGDIGPLVQQVDQLILTSVTPRLSSGSDLSRVQAAMYALLSCVSQYRPDEIAQT